MSDPLRVAVVAEGPTDAIVIEAALRAILSGRAFFLTLLQPEGSIAFGRRGGGWGGVYRWCKQSARRGSGRLAMDGLIMNTFDGVIIHADADVAAQKYADAGIESDSADGTLPCERPCPPARETTDTLRLVLLSWCGERSVPGKVVLCVPSKSMEAWVVAALFQNDSVVVASAPFECFANPESRLGQQPKQQRIQKSQNHYRDKAPVLEAEWPRIAVPDNLEEAHRFQCEALAVLPMATTKV